MNTNRRAAGLGIAAAWAALSLPKVPAVAAEKGFRLATFQADVTPPVGHPLLGGLKPPAASIKERLEARGIILLGAEKPLAIVALDWCELRNDAYDAFRDAIAKGLETTRERVLLSCIHQHDAPYCDLTAQKLLADASLAGAMFEEGFFKQTVSNVAKIAGDAVGKARPITHFAASHANVERVACNRRVELTPGKPNFSRYSFTSDPAVRNAPEGPIDPKLQSLGFYDGDKLLATVSVYAVHPMSYYGRGEVSYDFPGMARAMLDEAQPGVFHLYASGCSGDVVAARYNDGDQGSRVALSERLMAAMRQSIKRFEPQPLTQLAFRNVPLRLPPPETGSLAPDRLAATIADKTAAASQRITAALGRSYWERCRERPEIDLPVVDLGLAQYLLLPAEMFVEYQLAAQQLAPKKHLLIAGFGECAPGYIPTEKARREGFVEEHAYCWNRSGAEEAVLSALKQAIGA